MAVIILTGEIDSGKTSWCRNFLVHEKPGCDGILLLKIMVRNERIGYDAFRISTKESVPFARREEFEPEAWDSQEKVGFFSISKHGKSTANRWIHEAASKNRIIIDEIGPLEIRGGGFSSSLRDVLRESEKKEIFLVVRRGCVEEVCSVFKITNYSLLQVPPSV